MFDIGLLDNIRKLERTENGIYDAVQLQQEMKKIVTIYLVYNANCIELYD
jgi:hypothetical protein